MISKELLIFEVAGRDFSLPLSLVEEVVPTSPITPVPNSPPFLLGLAGVRGKVMGVIDASKRYGIGPALNSYFMICNVRGNNTAITIDRAAIAGKVFVRELSKSEVELLRTRSGVDEKFLKGGFELLETLEEGEEPKPSGRFFFEIDADLFVSAEMASRVGGM